MEEKKTETYSLEGRICFKEGKWFEMKIDSFSFEVLLIF